MTSYSLTLLIEPDILSALSDDEYNLCIQKYLGQVTLDGDNVGDVANVVAASIPFGEYSGKNQFKWTDEYQFAATQQAYNEGDIVVQATTSPPSPISTTTQDEFHLTSWSEWTVSHNSPDAPPNGFAFDVGSKVDLPGASALVYLNIAVGSDPLEASPFYISPTPDISGSITKYTPRDQVLVFFNQGAETGSMISESRAYMQPIDMTNTHNQTWQLSNKGIWSSK